MLDLMKKLGIIAKEYLWIEYAGLTWLENYLFL